ncbi:MAG: mannose-1-phosphate guanylyltransferase [Bacteroidales bacterium]|nr:mannose-1-phosphate guanylyltransferase [Bacteroidales bacterium]
MAGGVGSRLYPLSTPEHPKQFLDLLDCGKTLIRLTYERFLAVNPEARFWVVTSAAYVHFVNEQIPEIPSEQIIAEPAARNTAPCIALACWKIHKKYPDANIIVTPSDAYVPDVQAFASTARTALDFTASQDAIVCIGIRPSSPHTGYGYIQAPGDAGTVVKVESFKEKPDKQTAERYLAEGGYWWNAGIFVWNLATVEQELRKFAPGITSMMDRMAPALFTPSEGQTLAELFPQCEKISIDYAVMEKSSKVYVLAADWEWSDLGSFEAIEKIRGKILHF